MNVGQRENSESVGRRACGDRDDGLCDGRSWLVRYRFENPREGGGIVARDR
jgi:hypothetical protein